MTKPLVILAEPIDEECAQWLRLRARVESCAPADPRFDELLTHASGLVVRTYTRVDQHILNRAPVLCAVARAGVGVDNIDLEACAQRGIVVLNTPDANTHAVVEFVIAVIFDALRPRQSLDHALSPDEWMRLREDLIAPRQISELTVGVLGLGRIGSALARAARAFTPCVLYHDLLDIPEASRAGAAPVSFESLLAGADILTVHVDSRPSNRHLIAADELRQVKPDALLINTSRGFVIDAPALALHLRQNPNFTAVLDVHDPEPFDASYPLVGVANARLMPHIASASQTAKRNMSWVVRDLWEAMKSADS